jgi:hypothetical protein
LLYQEAERQKTKAVLSQIKDKFEKFERSEIRPEEFKSFIKNVKITIKFLKELNLNGSQKLDQLIDSNNGTNFSALITELDLLKKSEKKPESETKNNHYNPQHFRYKKSLSEPASNASENEQHYTIKKLTNDFISGKTNSEQFREALKNNGINPNVEAVKIKF